jgi:hypothetical protein
MSPDKQNIAIAQACGVVSKDHWGHLYKTEQGYARDCPDYLNDLNAMHEAERMLTPEYQPAKGESQWSDYLGWLGFCGENKTREVYECVTASAAQRAEAFLRTVGKWEEDK